MKKDIILIMSLEDEGIRQACLEAAREVLKDSLRCLRFFEGPRTIEERECEELLELIEKAYEPSQLQVSRRRGV